MSSSCFERSRKRDSRGCACPPGANASSAVAIVVGVGVQVEHRAVLEERPPLRVERDQVELVVQVAAGLGEDALQSTDGISRMVGPMSKRKPRLREHRGLAAEPVRSSRRGRRRSPAPPACRPRPARRGRRRSRQFGPIRGSFPCCIVPAFVGSAERDPSHAYASRDLDQLLILGRLVAAWHRPTAHGSIRRRRPARAYPGPRPAAAR